MKKNKLLEYLKDKLVLIAFVIPQDDADAISGILVDVDDQFVYIKDEDIIAINKSSIKMILDATNSTKVYDDGVLQ